MHESAQAALSFVRAHIGAAEARSARGLLPDARPPHPRAGRRDPEGRALGRRHDGDRARLADLRPAGAQGHRDDGRADPDGQVLPIGGLKEKALAAQAAGIERVIAPKLNEQDIEDIPEHLRKDIEFIFVDRIEQVLEEALEPQNGRRNGAAAATPARAPRARSAPSRDGRRRAAPAPRKARPHAARAPSSAAAKSRRRLALAAVRARRARTRRRAAGAGGRSSRPRRCRA